MGRNRKPLEMQTGNITKTESLTRKSEQESVTTDRDLLDKPPTWLIDANAKKEWKRIVEEIREIEILGNLDYNNLGGYCNAFANYVKVTKELKKQPYCVERETRTGTIIVANPMIGVQRAYAEEMRKFASLCGLTIDSRLKAAAVKTEDKKDEITQKFGDI